MYPADVKKKFIVTFCSLSWASRTSAVWPTARILSSRVSIRPSQTSTSVLFASYRWLSPNIASSCVFLCMTFEFVSSQCSLSLVTVTDEWYCENYASPHNLFTPKSRARRETLYDISAHPASLRDQKAHELLFSLKIFSQIKRKENVHFSVR